MTAGTDGKINSDGKMDPVTSDSSKCPLDGDGRCLVTVIADHRVLDGVAVAKSLARLEEVLATRIATELRNVRAAPGEAAA